MCFRQVMFCWALFLYHAVMPGHSRWCRSRNSPVFEGISRFFSWVWGEEACPAFLTTQSVCSAQVRPLDMWTARYFNLSTLINFKEGVVPPMLPKVHYHLLCLADFQQEVVVLTLGGWFLFLQSVYKDYSRGLKTQPWGAPVWSMRVDELCLPILTISGLPVKMPRIHKHSEVFSSRPFRALWC